MNHRFFFALASAFALTACGGGSVAPSASTTPSSPVPVGIALKNASGATIDSLTFFGAGTSNAQTFVATQLDGNGSLQETDTCTSSGKTVATVKAQSNSDATSTYTVTPQNAGACTITVSGAAGYSATLDVSITLTNVPIQ